VAKIRKREWELYRIVLHQRGTENYYSFYLRYQNDVFTASLPKKGSRENFAIKSISPSIPVIHFGAINDPSRQFGPGISFGIGAVLLGPLSIEWMFQPIGSLNDVVAIRSIAVGIFFNSFYGVLHYGVAWYTPSYSRAEAYIGINLVPAIQLLGAGKKQRYRW
jgi:hypothetical protein